MPIDLFRHIITQGMAGPYHQIFTPNPDLTSVIDCFFLYISDIEKNDELAFSDGLPWLGFMLDKPNMYCFSAHGQEIRREAGYLSGLWLEGIYINRPSSMRRLLGVRFTHEGLYHLLKEPVCQLSLNPY